MCYDYSLAPSIFFLFQFIMTIGKAIISIIINVSFIIKETD